MSCTKAHPQATDETEKSALMLLRSFAELQASSVRLKIKTSPQAIDEADRQH